MPLADHWQMMLDPLGVTATLAPSKYAMSGDVAAEPVSLYRTSASVGSPVTDVKVVSVASTRL